MFAAQMSELPAVLAVLAILILFNALFAASEMSIATARRSRLQARSEEGDEGARLALILQENPNRFLSTAQVGITFVGTLAAVFSGDRLEQPLSVLYRPWAGEWTRIAVLGTVVLGVAFAQLLLGELVPKRIGLRSADLLAALTADGAAVTLADPALPAPGQACVMYRGDRVLGGGFVRRPA